MVDSSSVKWLIVCLFVFLPGLVQVAAQRVEGHGGHVHGAQQRRSRYGVVIVVYGKSI